MRIITTIVVLIIVSFAISSTVKAAEDGYAIVNATIIPVTSDIIENGTLLIKGDQIVALGRNVDIPPEAKQIDCSGLYVYPGMINAISTLGLSEIGAVPVAVTLAFTGRSPGNICPSAGECTIITGGMEFVRLSCDF